MEKDLADVYESSSEDGEDSSVTGNDKDKERKKREAKKNKRKHVRQRSS